MVGPLPKNDTAADGSNSSNANYFTALVGLAEEGPAPPPAPSQPAKKPRLKYPLIWIDLEMTGLDLEKDTILQIACIITDGALKTAVEGKEYVIHHDEVVLAEMNEWCVENHGKSGLTQAVRDSDISLAEAEARTLEFIMEHVPEPNTAQIAGNSVHVDVAFMRKYMPSIVEYAHYRIVDVSSIGECIRRWLPRTYGRAPKKQQAHTAMADIQESIEQLRYYKKHAFVKSE